MQESLIGSGFRAIPESLKAVKGEFPADFYSMVSAGREPFPFGRQARLIAILVVGLLLGNWFAPANPSLAVRILGSATIVAGLYPSWRWLKGGDRGLPFLPIFGLLFIMYYAAPIFMLKTLNHALGDPPIPDWWVARAQVLALLSLLLIYFGFYGSAELFARTMPRVRMRWISAGHCKLMAICLGLLGLTVYAVAHLLKVDAEGAQFVYYLGSLCMVGVTILFIMQLLGYLDGYTTLFLWCFLIPARMLLGFSGASTFQGLMVAMLLIFAYSAVRRRLPWVWIGIGAASIFLIRPVKMPMMMLTRDPGSPFHNGSEAQKAELFLRLTEEALSGRIPYPLMFQFAAARLADITMFAEVVHETPRVVGYWNGKTYEPLLYKFVPRFLDPNKPLDTSGQDFGHRYGTIGLSDHETTVNMAQLIELYINYGVVGIIVGSLLFGIIYQAVHAMFVHPEMGFGALIAALVVLSGLFQIESAAALVFGGLLWVLVFVGLISLVMEIGELRISAHGLPLA